MSLKNFVVVNIKETLYSILDVIRYWERLCKNTNSYVFII
jgi:hypothetical protein